MVMEVGVGEGAGGRAVGLLPEAEARASLPSPWWDLVCEARAL